MHSTAVGRDAHAWKGTRAAHMSDQLERRLPSKLRSCNEEASRSVPCGGSVSRARLCRRLYPASTARNDGMKLTSCRSSVHVTRMELICSSLIFANAV